MDTISNIQNAILNFCEDAKIVPWNNGGIQVTVEDAANIPGVLSTVAQVLYDYDCNDVQITTNQARFEVYIDEIDREDEREDPECWPEDELPMSERPVPIKKGDIICYRPNLVKVLQVTKFGAWIEGPYGEVQEIDWEDIQRYNPDFYDDSEDENGEEHCSRGEVDDD